jgi:hypothetical protein
VNPPAWKSNPKNLGSAKQKPENGSWLKKTLCTVISSPS